VLFAEKNCVACHRVGGTGGTIGPDLVDAGARRSPIEFAASLWNKAPAMMAAMQAQGITVPQLRPEEMADLVAYLYSVRYFGGGRISYGWKVLSDKGCLYCHAIYGERGKTASDLTKGSPLDSPPMVIAALWNHTLVTPTVAGKKLAWPVFRPQEMADLVALLQSLPRREGPAQK
jgi:mono/diheme cytochrome c family protein